MISEEEIGQRIKELRIGKALTLEELGSQTGLSKGYLSKIENGKKAPPVSSLIAISKALNVSIAEIFGETETDSISFVKKGQREVVARDGSIFGYSYLTLTHKLYQKRMEPYLLILPLSPKEKAIFQHKGEEMLFVLQGKMRFYYGEREFIVEEGDTLYFDASIPHYGVCAGNEEVQCLMVICAGD